MVLRSGEIEKEIVRGLGGLDRLVITAPSDAGVAKQDARMRMRAGNGGKKQWPAVGIGIPGMHKHYSSSGMGVLPDWQVVLAGDRILVGCRMQLDERRGVKMLPAF